MLTWDIIAYTGDQGGYEIYCTPDGLTATDSDDEVWVLCGATVDKTAGAAPAIGLSPNTAYKFKVRTRTDPHDNNPNTLYSEFTGEATATTLNSTDEGGGSGGGCFIETGAI